MSDDKRKDDAADKAPRPVAGEGETSILKTQDAPNYADREDGGRTLPTEDINSANDE